MKRYRLNKDKFITALLTIAVLTAWAMICSYWITMLIEHPNW